MLHRGALSELGSELGRLGRSQVIHLAVRSQHDGTGAVHWTAMSRTAFGEVLDHGPDLGRGVGTSAPRQPRGFIHVRAFAAFSAPRRS